jgi:hypothetical protein
MRFFGISDRSDVTDKTGSEKTRELEYTSDRKIYIS